MYVKTEFSNCQSSKSQRASLPIDSHPFRSMSIGCPIPGIPIPSIGRPIPGIRLIQNLILKIQGQGHGWGELYVFISTISDEHV